jgi:hypothetical protein
MSIEGVIAKSLEVGVREWVIVGGVGGTLAAFTSLRVGVRVNKGNWVRTALMGSIEGSLASLGSFGFSTVAMVFASASSIVFVTRKASVVSVTAVEASLGNLLS